MKKIKHLIICLLIFLITFSFSSCAFLEFIPSDFSKVELIYEGNSGKRYFYEHLSKNAKVAYTLVLNNIKNHSLNIDIPIITEQEFNEVFHAISYDNPDCICLGLTSELKKVGNKCYFMPSYLYTKDECDKLCNELNVAVDKIISNMPQGLDDFNKEKYLHDYICNFCEYDYSDQGANKTKAYDALVLGKAVCEGYARGIQLLLNKANIDNYLIVGKGTNSKGKVESHMWNIVSLNGKNYHLDATWDDFGKKETPSISYTYFNVTDKAISKNHFNFMPAENNCVSLENNYFVKNGIYFDSYKKFNYDKAISCLISSKKQNNFEVAFSTKEVFNNAKKNLIDNGDIYDIVDLTNKKYKSKKFSNVLYVLDDDMFVIHFIFE